MTMCHLDSIQGLGERTYLIDLDQDRVGCPHLDTFLQELDIGNEEVVTHQLATVTDGSGQLHPVVPVVLIQTILDRINRIFSYQFFQELDLLLGSEFLTIRILLLAILQLAIIIVPLTILLYGKLARSTVHGNLHVLAWLIASVLDSLADAL